MAITLHIGEYQNSFRPDSLNITESLGQRGTCEFEVQDPGGGYNSPSVGQPVEVRQDGTLIFGGTVDEVERFRPAGTTHLYSRIRSTDYNHLADKRSAGEYAWTNRLAGDIVKDIVANSLSGEGLDVSLVEDGPTIEKFETNYSTCAEAIGAVADLAQFCWVIDYGKRLKFFAPGSYAGAALAGADIRKDTIRLRVTREEYENRIVGKVGNYLTEPQTETFTGDGARKSWEMQYPMATEPVVTVNAGAQTVGIDGVETGKQWYWNAGSKALRQDDAEPALTAGQQLSATYTGQATAIVAAQNADEIASRAAVEGGSGVYEAVIEVSDPSTSAQAQQKVQAEVDRRSAMSSVLTFQTRLAIAAGERRTIDVPGYGSAEYLVRSVRTFDEGGRLLWRDVEAVNGPALADALEWFKGMGGHGWSMPSQGASSQPGEYVPPSDAPNVNAATAEVVTEQIAGETWFHFAGAITLPVAHPDYSDLRWIHIVAIGPLPTSEERPMGGVYVPGQTSPVAWRSDAWKLGEGNSAWDFEFRCENPVGKITANPYTVGNVLVTGQAAKPLNPTSVTAAEIAAERRADAQALVSTPIEVEYTMPADHHAEFVTVWVTSYDGNGWDWAGRWWLTDPIRFYRIVPAAGASWRVKVVTGRWDAQASGEVVSAVFPVAALEDAAGNGITDAALGQVGYGTGYQGTGTQKWWGIDHITFTLPANDVNFWHSVLTVQKVRQDGTPAPDHEGVERPVAEHTGAGAAIDLPILYWTIPEPGSEYRYFRFRLHTVSRNLVRVLQTGAWSGAAFAQIEVPQPPDKGYLDLSTAAASSIKGLKVGLDGLLQPDVGDGVQIDGSNHLTLRLGGGLSIALGAATVNAGNGLGLVGNQVQFRAGDGLSVNYQNLVIPNLGSGLSLYGQSIQANLGGGLSFSGSAVQVNTGPGTVLSGGSITLNLGNGLAIYLGAAVVDKSATGGLTSVGNQLAVSLGGGLGMSGNNIYIPANGVTKDMVYQVKAESLQVGTVTVTQTMDFSGSGGINVTSGGSVTVFVGGVTSKTGFSGGDPVSQTSSLLRGINGTYVNNGGDAAFRNVYTKAETDGRYVQPNTEPNLTALKVNNNYVITSGAVGDFASLNIFGTAAIDSGRTSSLKVKDNWSNPSDERVLGLYHTGGVTYLTTYFGAKRYRVAMAEY